MYNNLYLKRLFVRNSVHRSLGKYLYLYNQNLNIYQQKFHLKKSQLSLCDYFCTSVWTSFFDVGVSQKDYPVLSASKLNYGVFIQNVIFYKVKGLYI